MDDEIMVSISCLVYNHEKYLRQCLDGFVMQKTDFRFEVLVHDDASTDGSADIIREYEQKYPDLIKPIYQTKNKYSLGVRIAWRYQYSRAKGKYIALCEGDDFWTDENKLQKQFDALERTGAVFCSHLVRYVTEDGAPMERWKPADPMEEGLYTKEDWLALLLSQNNCPFQCSSYFFRVDAVLNYMKRLPLFYRLSPVGDVPLQLLLALEGTGFYYYPEPMSCYRRMSAGSWTQRTWSNKAAVTQYEERLCKMYEAFDQYTEYAYHAQIDELVRRHYFEVLRNNHSFRTLCSKRYRDLFRQLKLKERVYILFRSIVKEKPDGR